MAQWKRDMKSVKQPAKSQRITQELIARKAYELFEKSGRIAGRDLENWFEAEHLLQAQVRQGN